MRGRPVTPPGGLDIGQYDKHLKEQLPKKKKEYKDMLDQQQKDQMYLRARQEPEMPVLDRAGPQQATYLTSKPPAGPQQNYTHATYQPRDEQDQERRRHEEARVQRGAPAEVQKDHHYGSVEYEKFQKRLNRQEGEEYREFLKKDEDQNGYGTHAPQNYENQVNSLRINHHNGEYATVPDQQYAEVRDHGRVSDHQYAPVRDQQYAPVRDQQYAPVRDQQYETEHQYQDRYTPQRPAPRSSHQQSSSNMHAVMNHAGLSQPTAQPQRNGDSYIPASLDHTMDPYRTNPDRFHQQMTAPYPKAPRSLPGDNGSIPATPNKLSLPVGSYDEARPFIEKERNRQYNDYIAKLPPIKSSRGGMTPHATALTLPVGAYDDARPTFERQRNQEYNNLKQEGKLDNKKRSLRQKAPTPPDQQGIFESQNRYEGYIKNMETQRNKEYNEFLNKKYLKGKMSSRSEPDRQSGPFFPGNEDEQDMKKRYLAEERSRQYNQMLREQEPPRSRSVNIPSDVDSGLPIGQQHHESWRRFLREQRNREYNQMMTKNQDVRNREWNYGNSGVLDLRGEDQTQSKKQVLREERQKEYKEYMSQKVPPVHVERRSRSEPATPSSKSVSNPIVNALGHYNDTRRKLIEDRKKEFKSFMTEKKQHEVPPKRGLADSFPTMAKDEKPLVNKMGLYEVEKRKKFVQERRMDFASFSQEKAKHLTPRTNVKENMMPHVASAETPLVNYMGRYDEEKHKFRIERNKDLREFAQKKAKEYHSPYDNFVYPMVAVAEKPLVDYMGRDVEARRSELRQERRTDYERYQSKQRMKDAPRRHDYYDNKNEPYQGIFSGLGDHGNAKEMLGQQRKQEYQEHLNNYPHPKAQGRPTWVKETLPNNTDRGRSPVKNPPPVDHYQQMLDEKRREEAQRRRFDDPEIQGRLNSREGRYMPDRQQNYGGYYQQDYQG